jgi:toxin ParE1/3/4
MAYLIEITRRAARDLGHIYEDIHAEESAAALIWYRGLKETVLSLELRPARCPATPETGKLRHLPYGKKPHIYRVFTAFWKNKRRLKCCIFATAHGSGLNPAL